MIDPWAQVPTGRRVETADGPRNLLGTARGLPQAGEDRVKLAARHWLQGRTRDFEELGGGLWRDQATGTSYKRMRHDPLLDADPRQSGVSAFLVIDDSMIFLRRTDSAAPVGEERDVGVVGGRKAGPGDRRGLTLEETLARGGWNA
jgi:hypothetical protein